MINKFVGIPSYQTHLISTHNNKMIRLISFFCYILGVHSHCEHIRITGLGVHSTLYTYSEQNTYISTYKNKILTHDKKDCLWRTTDLNTPYNTYTIRDCDVDVDTGFSDSWVYESGDIYMSYTYLNASLECADHEIIYKQAEIYSVLLILIMTCSLISLTFCCGCCASKKEGGQERINYPESDYENEDNSCMPTPLPTPRSSGPMVHVSEIV